MSISIQPELELKLRARASAEGLSVEKYLERLVGADQEAGDELASLALEGLASGEPITPASGYWEEKHRRLEERLKATIER